MAPFKEIKPGVIEEWIPELNRFSLGGPYSIVKKVGRFSCKYDLASLTADIAYGVFNGGLGERFGQFVKDFANGSETKSLYSGSSILGQGQATLIKVGKEIIVTFDKPPEERGSRSSNDDYKYDNKGGH